MFPVTKEQKGFIQEHKEINWSATLRKELDYMIREVKKSEMENK